MEIPAEQLERLAAIGVFAPSGINDHERQDLSDGDPFLVVDDMYAAEADDGIRTKARRGGYLVEIAIADGAQLSQHPEIVAEAMRRKSSVYHPRYETPMLPIAAIKQLELRSSRRRRATVIRQSFDADGDPNSDIAVTPAYIQPKCITPAQLARKLHGADPDLLPLKRFADTQIGRNGTRQPAEIDGLPVGAAAHKAGSIVLQAYMVLGNRSMGSWVTERGIPHIRRVWDGTQLAHYQVNSGIHIGVNTEEASLYAPFSSPLRRAVDLLLHLQVGKYLAGKHLPYDSDDLQQYVATLGPQLAT